MLPSNPDRPPLPDRYEMLTEIKNLIRKSETLYRETGQDTFLDFFNSLRRIERLFHIDEEKYRQEELDEAFKYIALLPHSVRTWLL